MNLKPAKATMLLVACTALIFMAWFIPQAVRSQGLATPHYLPVVVKGFPTATPTSRPGYVLISEVMYDPSGAEPDGEWIELYNPGSSPVDLSTYKLGDEETMGEMEGMVIFPAGSFLSAGDVIVIANRATAFYQVYGELPDFEMHESHPSVPDLLKYSAWSGGNIELVNGGDEVLLLDEKNAIADGLSWGNSLVILDPSVKVVASTHSLDRSPANRDTDTAEDWIDQWNPSPGKVDLSTPTPTSTSTPQSTPMPPEMITLLISEVVYNPLVEPEGEWFEIYNYGETAISLAGIRIGDEETEGGGEGMSVFPITAQIGSGDTAVIANRSMTFKEQYGFNPDYEMNNSDPAVTDMLRDIDWGSGSVILQNNGDELILLDQDGDMLDGLSWGSSDVILSPPAAGVEQGHSLERYPPGQDTNTSSDWRNQANPGPGGVDLSPSTPTPTVTATPTPTVPPILVINEIQADPDLTFGDANGDGVADPLEDEFVEIVNVTGSTVDLSGWTLRDSSGVRHNFPPYSLVIDQCAVLIFGGGLPAGNFGGSLVQLASSGGLGLNNGGDSVALVDPSEVAVFTYTYGIEGGDDQSLTRYPDITGDDPLIKHSTAPGSNGALFSPGRRIDGAGFPGCSGYKGLWIRKPVPAPGGSP